MVWDCSNILVVWNSDDINFGGCPMTPHPQRCETCNKEECYHHPQHFRKVSLWSAADHDKVWKFTSKYGCASHSSKIPTPAAPMIDRKAIDDVVDIVSMVRIMMRYRCGEIITAKDALVKVFEIAEPMIAATIRNQTLDDFDKEIMKKEEWTRLELLAIIAQKKSLRNPSTQAQQHNRGDQR